MEETCNCSALLNPKLWRKRKLHNQNYWGNGRLSACLGSLTIQGPYWFLCSLTIAALVPMYEETNNIPSTTVYVILIWSSLLHKYPKTYTNSHPEEIHTFFPRMKNTDFSLNPLSNNKTVFFYIVVRLALNQAKCVVFPPSLCGVWPS